MGGARLKGGGALWYHHLGETLQLIQNLMHACIQEFGIPPLQGH